MQPTPKVLSTIKPLLHEFNTSSLPASSPASDRQVVRRSRTAAAQSTQMGLHVQTYKPTLPNSQSPKPFGTLPAHLTTKSQSRLPSHETFPVFLAKRHIHLPPRRKPKHLIPLAARDFRPSKRRIHPFSSQGDFVLLVIVRAHIRADQPQKDRHRIPRQPAPRESRKSLPIERACAVGIDSEGRASRAAIVPWHKHAIDVRFRHAWERAQRFRDFGGGDVLRFPAIGVAQPVEEEPSPVVIPA